MKWEFVLPIFVLLTGWCFQPVTGDFETSDEHPDIGHDEDVHPNSFRETTAEVLDMNTQTSRDIPDMDFETNWDISDINKDNYGDADWHPPPSHLETHPDPSPVAPPVMHSSNTGVDDGTSQTFNRTIVTSSARCGEYSSQLMSNGQCRLMATLPPVGTSQKRCPDMFRCTDDISNWLHENQNRKEQLEEMRETMSELQEELRNHRHRVKALEVQGEESVRLNLTFDQRLHSLELRHAKADTMLRVHAALLYELQAQLRNLSATVHRMSRTTGCAVNVIRATPPLGMRDTLPPVLLHNAIPFVGFGFLDNAIMIAAGTQIELSIGVTLGISTMAAAALGNLVSDLAGLGLAGYVEALASKLGMQVPDLTPKQVDMWQTRLSSHMGKAIGVSIGCILGMFPLFFLDDEKEKEKEAQPCGDAASHS
ncbi:fibrinogen-like protein 1 isoform X1 [Lates japonicus]|uniref:Fibrinogen-like protein 1 isoform X1 n=1 Tax=Lates japonicus TaxID=270547 RepID=A0AAD3MSB6_LATJO|nr:fibrinogen-like protein 1 isoform X1 [Lates japonicus]